MKTSLVLTLSGTFVATVGLIVWLITADKDITPLLIALPIIVTGIGGIFGINKVQKQTNGTLTQLRADKLKLEIENAALRTHLSPEQAPAVALTVAELERSRVPV